MTDVVLKGVHRVRSKGRDYWYAWRGGPRLAGTPGSKEFLNSYLVATRGHSDSELKIAGLVVSFKGSRAYSDLADSTKRIWSPWLDRIKTDLGKLSIKTFDRPEIRQVIKRWRDRWADTPRTADLGKQVLSAVLSYAVEEGLLGKNPCFGISNLYRVNRSDLIWLPDDIAKFAECAVKEFVFALRLACLTGLRESDLIALRWDDIDDISIVMKTGKSAGRLEYVVPRYDELNALLEEIKAYQVDRAAKAAKIPKAVKGPYPTVIIASRGRPWTPNGFQSAWGDAKEAVRARYPEYMDEFELHFHDARGTAATKFATAGYSDEEIAEVVGWEKAKVTKIVDRYVRRGARLKAKIQLMNRATADSAAEPENADL